MNAIQFIGLLIPLQKKFAEIPILLSCGEGQKAGVAAHFRIRTGGVDSA